MSLPVLLDALVYSEGEPESRIGNDAYSKMQSTFKILFKDAMPDDDYNYLTSDVISHNLTDLLIDLLNVDYRTNLLTSKTAFGSVIKNVEMLSSHHKGDLYLAWLQTEDDYYSNKPTDTKNIYGNKSIIFKDLGKSIIWRMKKARWFSMKTWMVI